MSVIAGEKALFETVSSRMIIPFAVMFGPVIVLALLRQRKLMPTSKILSAMLEVSLCSGTLLISLPLAIAAFPQQSSISAAKLENEYQS